MGIFSWISGKRTIVKNSMADVRDTLNAGVTWAGIGANVSGYFSSVSAFNDLKRNIQTFYSRELMDTKLSLKLYKNMHKSSKKFNKYADPKRVTKLFNKYASSNPKKLEKKTTALVNKAIKELEIYTKSYTQLIQVVRDEMLKEKQMVVQSNNYLLALFNDIERIQREKKVWIPAEILATSRRLMADAVREEIEALDTELRDIDSAAKGIPISKPMFSIFSNDTYWEKQVKKYTKKYKKREDAELRNNLQILKTELSSGVVSMITLNRVVKHLQSFKETRTYLKAISHDVMAFLIDAEEISNNLVQANLRFLAMFRATPAINGAIKCLNDLKDANQNAVKAAGLDRNDVSTLRQYLFEVNKKLSDYFVRFSSNGRFALQDLQQRASNNNATNVVVQMQKAA